MPDRFTVFLALMLALAALVCSCIAHQTAERAGIDEIHGTPRAHLAGAPTNETTREDQPQATAPQPARQAARASFAASVRSWGRWLTGTLVLIGVAGLVLSFLPAGHLLGISTTEAVICITISGCVPMVSYGLQAWGVLAADTVAVLILAAIVCAAVVLAIAVFRRGRAIERGIEQRLAPQEPRP